MGFVGEHSEIAWIYRLKRLLEQVSVGSKEIDTDRQSVASASFFLDDSDITVLDDIDLSQRPAQTVADQLVDEYFQVVHPSFPIIGKLVFFETVQVVLLQSSRTPREEVARSTQFGFRYRRKMLSLFAGGQRRGDR